MTPQGGPAIVNVRILGPHSASCYFADKADPWRVDVTRFEIEYRDRRGRLRSAERGGREWWIVPCMGLGCQSRASVRAEAVQRAVLGLIAEGR